MRDEAVVSNSDQFADECMRLDLREVSDRYSLLNLDEGPDETVISYSAAIQVCGLNDCNVDAKSYINQSYREYSGGVHTVLGP